MSKAHLENGFRGTTVIQPDDLRHWWPQADAGEVRPCSRCPRLQLESAKIDEYEYVAVDTYHFWNEVAKRKLVIKLEYFCRDMRAREYFMETNYFMYVT